MKKLIPFLFVLVSCTSKVIQYDLVYVRLNRENTSEYLEQYSAIKLRVGHDSVKCYYPEGQYGKLSEAIKSFQSDTFKLGVSSPIFKKIPKEGMLEIGYLAGIPWDEFHIGDTLNQWKHFSMSSEDNNYFVCTIFAGKRERNKEEFVTIAERWYAINDEKLLPDHYYQYTYNKKTNLLAESFCNYAISVNWMDRPDTLILVSFKKTGNKLWNQCYLPDTTFLARKLEEQRIEEKKNDSLLSFVVKLNGRNGGLVEFNDIENWDSLNVSPKYFENTEFATKQVINYHCILENAVGAKPYGIIYGNKISDEIRTNALASNKGSFIIFYDIKVMDFEGKTEILHNGPVFRIR